MTNAASDGCAPSDSPADVTPDIRYRKCFEALSDLAPTLKEAELRVALELVRCAADAGSASVRASSRDLASRCKLSRPKAQAALDSLAARSLIATRQGTATSASAHRLNFLETVSMGGSFREPPSRTKDALAPLFEWSPKDARVAPFGSQGGTLPEPGGAENKQLTPAARRVDDSTVSPPILDRVLTCKPSNFEPELLAVTRRYLQTYMLKLGRDEAQRPYGDGRIPHPPDDRIVAQVLAIAEPHRIFPALDTLLAERKEAYSYGWFVTVLLQRIHGISWTQTKQARAALRVVRASGKPSIAEPPTPDAREFVQETLDTLGAIAQKKAIR